MAVTTSIFDPALTTEQQRKDYLGGDEHENAEPVHSSKYDIDANSQNRIVKAVAECAGRIGAGGSTVYPFSRTALGAGTSSWKLYRPDGFDPIREWAVAPFAGSVVGFVVQLTAARTAGALTVKWEKNGTPQAFVAQISTNVSKLVVSQAPGIDTFAAGDELAVTCTTTGDWAGGADVMADLILARG